MIRGNARHAIIKSMVALLEVEKFDYITIKQICAESGVHRSTFYAHFEDKYQLMDTIQSYHMRKYHRLMQYTKNLIEGNPLATVKQRLLQVFRLLFKYMYRFKTYFMGLVLTQSQYKLVRDYIQFTKEGYSSMLEALPQLQHTTYFIDYTVGGQLAIIYSWLSGDCKEDSAQMAQILYNNIFKINR
ncbi:TetR/AcrR family transcriptional regulator [Staphylococcus agnetis]|uniref:TetR/AcrR family transcriptional regulator n=1 Tax=Staphylococcus agnetis TaxID=985762 RepID=UPI00208FCEB9|nr:TetR/AcrR family transcriptional regulator [Staphylococcus agnetis]MCO4338960.1 TetR/AcrR family transcriptional regulator [Staphylococcus agnetis]